MAYNQQHPSQRAQPPRFYNGPPQDQQSFTRNREGYNGHFQRNDIHQQYSDPSRVEANGYDQYGGNPYATVPMHVGQKNSREARTNTEPINMQRFDGSADYYEEQGFYQPEATMQQRPLPNSPRNRAAPGAGYPVQQPRGPPFNGRRQDGPPMSKRMPPSNGGLGPRMNPNIQGNLNYNRQMHNAGYANQPRPEPGLQHQLVEPYVSHHIRTQSGPNDARPRADSRGVNQQNPQHHRGHAIPDRKAFAGPNSPETRNFDNPFPMFPSNKQTSKLNDITTEILPQPIEPSRHSQEIYNGIVGIYAGDDRQSVLPADNCLDGYGDYIGSNATQPGQEHASPYGQYDIAQDAPQGWQLPPQPDQRQARPEFRAPRNQAAWNDNTSMSATRQINAAQFPIPLRPGTAPEASRATNNRPNGDPRFHDHSARPLPDRSRSDFQGNNAGLPRTIGNTSAPQNAFPYPATRHNGDMRANTAYSSPNNPNNYGQTGPDVQLAYPQREAMQHHHNNSEPYPDRTKPAQWQSHPQGNGLQGPNLTQHGVSDWASNPALVNPSMGGAGRRVERFADPTFGEARGSAPNPQNSSRSQFPQPERIRSNESQSASPNPRLNPAQVAPRQQSPTRRHSPPRNVLSPPPNAAQVASLYGASYSRSFEQLPRPSMERADGASSRVLQSKRSATNLPNRANVERPTFYQATGAIAPSPPITFAVPVPLRQPLGTGTIVSHRDETGRTPQQTQKTQGRSNPDALPHHATPVDPDAPGSEIPIASVPRPPPVRQYVSEAPSSGSAPVNKRKPSLPITQEELSRLREIVRTHPTDTKTQLILAKKLGEFAKSGGGVASGAARLSAKDQERYNAEAYKLVKKLVGGDNMDAMFYLAECYGDSTLGLANNPKEAFTNYQAAAKLGHASAAYRTAVCCEIGPEEGGGTRKDLQKALQWYKRAASLGDVPATYKMGIILLKGLLGQEKSTGEAVGYLKRAAERADEENPHALHELGLLYESPKNPGLIVRDEAEAFTLFGKAAKLGYKFSQFKLGQAYEYGLLGCKVDARNSIIWYTKAAAQGEHQSELALSGWYLTGSEGILEHSDTEAYLWARKAALAEPPLPKAMFAMGYFTEVGIGCPRSLEEAKRWYGRAAAYKFPKAQEHLEELQRGGSKVQKNREKLSRGNAKQEAECRVM